MSRLAMRRRGVTSPLRATGCRERASTHSEEGDAALMLKPGRSVRIRASACSGAPEHADAAVSTSHRVHCPWSGSPSDDIERPGGARGVSELLLGIDIGTSSSKGVLARLDGAIVAVAERPHPLVLP